jgi:hypothetical protein
VFLDDAARKQFLPVATALRFTIEIADVKFPISFRPAARQLQHLLVGDGARSDKPDLITAA